MIIMTVPRNARWSANTVTSATITNDSIVNADINSAAEISLSKL